MKLKLIIYRSLQIKLGVSQSTHILRILDQVSDCCADSDEQQASDDSAHNQSRIILLELHHISSLCLTRSKHYHSIGLARTRLHLTRQTIITVQSVHMLGFHETSRACHSQLDTQRLLQSRARVWSIQGVHVYVYESTA